MKTISPKTCSSTFRSARGNAMVEYTVVLLLLVVVLVTSPDVIMEIIDALKNLYAAFTAALGQTYPTPVN